MTIFLGYDVSFGLDFDQESCVVEPTLLPDLSSFADIAQWLQIRETTLKWLTYDRQSSRFDHYFRFSIPKKSGGRRAIAAPKKQLRKAQSQIANDILPNGIVHDAAMAYIKRRNILHNALRHCERPLVIRLDIRDFFPSVGFQRVKKVFKRFGYNEGVQTVLALLCTDRPRVEEEQSGKIVFTRSGRRHLPQGAPSSPTLSNLAFYDLDCDLKKLAIANSFEYTRYADDLFFSGPVNQLLDYPQSDIIRTIVRGAREIINADGFAVHPYKTHVWGRHIRQRVTGLTVNRRPNIPRSEWRRFRAFLHCVESNGLEENAVNHARGYASFVSSIDAYKGEKIRRRHSWIVSATSCQPTFSDRDYDDVLIYKSNDQTLFAIDADGQRFTLSRHAERPRSFIDEFFDDFDVDEVDDTHSKDETPTESLVTDSRLRKVAIGRYIVVLEALRDKESQRRQLDAKKAELKEKNRAIKRKRTKKLQEIKEFVRAVGLTEKQFHFLLCQDAYLKNEIELLFHSAGLDYESLEDGLEPSETRRKSGYGLSNRKDLSNQELPENSVELDVVPYSAAGDIASTRLGYYIKSVYAFAKARAEKANGKPTNARAVLPQLPRKIVQELRIAKISEPEFCFLVQNDLALLTYSVLIAVGVSKHSEFWDVVSNDLAGCCSTSDIDRLQLIYSYGDVIGGAKHASTNVRISRMDLSSNVALARMRARLSMLSALADIS